MPAVCAIFETVLLLKFSHKNLGASDSLENIVSKGGYDCLGIFIVEVTRNRILVSRYEKWALEDQIADGRIMLKFI